MLRTFGCQRAARPLSERGAEPAHASKPGRCLKAGRCGFSPSHRCCGCHLRDHGSRCGWPAGEAATYAHTGTAVAFFVSELPGVSAEALFIAMAALVPTAGAHPEIQSTSVGGEIAYSIRTSSIRATTIMVRAAVRSGSSSRKARDSSYRCHQRRAEAFQKRVPLEHVALMQRHQ
jgi:hypothetical protein